MVELIHRRRWESKTRNSSGTTVSHFAWGINSIFLLGKDLSIKVVRNLSSPRSKRFWSEEEERGGGGRLNGKVGKVDETLERKVDKLTFLCKVFTTFSEYSSTISGLTRIGTTQFPTVPFLALIRYFQGRFFVFDEEPKTFFKHSSILTIEKQPGRHVTPPNMDSNDFPR